MDRQYRPGTGTRVSELTADVPASGPGKRTLVETELVRGGVPAGSTALRHVAPPSQVAERRRELNAALKVVAYDIHGRVLVAWGAKARWEGLLPQHFRGERAGGEWTWDNGAARTVRINTRADGTGGQSVEVWATNLRAARVEIFAEARDAVDRSADSEDAQDPNAEGRASEANNTLHQLGHDQVRYRDTGTAASEGSTRTQLTTDAAPTSASADRVSGGDAIDEHLDDAIALEHELGIDLDQDEQQDEDGLGRAGYAGGGPTAHTGMDTTATGHGPGGETAKEGGDREGSVSTRDNQGTSAGDRDGDRLGSENGLPFGEGRDGDDGIRGGGGLIFGGVIAVPAALKGVVEVALLFEAGDLTGAGASLFRAGIGRAASIAAARRLVAHEARIAAAKELRVLLRQLTSRKAFTTLTKSERDQALRVVYWEYQRRFFRGYLQAAKAEQRAAKKALRTAKPSNAAAETRQTAANTGEEIATVEPVAGRLPVNHEYAGKGYPRSDLPAKYRGRELRFKKTGYPDFEPYAMTLPNGKKSVHINYTGSRKADDAAANAAAGLKKKPHHWTWHHEEGDRGRMLLVPEDLHDTVRHTGGTAEYKHQTGLEYAN